MRKAVVAGMFYENDKNKLIEEIKKCFINDLGPGTVEFYRDNKRKIKGVIVPHAGYLYSGPCAAHGYKEIAESKKIQTYIIIGTSHIGTSHMGTSFPALSMQDFETPLGIVKNDNDLSKILIEKGIVKEDDYPHIREHSVEVQLPFLQFIDKDFKIVPIVVGHDIDYESFGKRISEAIDSINKEVAIICSSDFTHYGINYSFIPFEDDVKERIEKLDKGAIKFIKNFDAWSFIDYVKETKATICGAYAIAGFVEACKYVGAKEAKVLKYYCSGEISKDYNNCVGYSSIVVE